MGYASVNDAVGTRLRADTALIALVGTRVSPVVPTQDPNGDYLVHRVVSGGGGNDTLDGRGGLQRYLVQVEVYASTVTASDAILSAAADRLAGWVDRANGVHGCFAEGDVNQDILGDGTNVPGQAFGVWFQRGA